MLTAFTGRGNFEMTVTLPAGSSRTEPRAVPAKAITLKWTNFQYAAEQAGLSRQYGGIHFEDGDVHAREAGAAVGKTTWAKALTYFNGSQSLQPLPGGQCRGQSILGASHAQHLRSSTGGSSRTTANSVEQVGPRTSLRFRVRR